MAVMLASDLCRLLLRRQPPALLAQLQQWSAASEEVVISAITYAELVAAALLTTEKDRHMALVEAFCERLDAVVPWDSTAVSAYTVLQRQLLQEQRSLNMNDVMIAAHAQSLDAMLMSGSERSFAGLHGLQVRVWPGSA
jgi:tRNA(fMet)-specific endonuclease VapC